MDTSKLKKFAQEARRSLMSQVASKMKAVLAEGSAASRENPKAVKELQSQIAAHGEQQVVERVAYTWFNRFSALRFMDVNGYNSIGAISPADGQTRPEILAEAAAGHIDGDIPGTIRQQVAALLDGGTPSRDPQGEAYRLLLVAVCNQWHSAMPFMFEKIADYTELLMPEDLLSANSVLAHMREVMTGEACQDVEIIGWLYQFYISEKKDQVFAGLKKNQKITAENIPAATQLFTPHWIVRYLVENSLGRLWLLNRPQSKLAAQMDYYIAPEEHETDFLKIKSPEDIRICDPACGSGHMLTYAFDLLYAIYEEEGYEAAEIPTLILAHNLTGVEIDDRAGALAAFALTMKAAAKLGRRKFLRMEAKPNICVLQNVRFTEAEMQDVAAVVGKDLFTDELCKTLAQFEQAKNFGSLIVPKLRDPAETLRVVEARDFDGDLLLKEVQERVVAVLRMAEALSPKYQAVVANPPYMGGKGMNGPLADLAKASYKNSKTDLFAMFIERGFALVPPLGYSAMVTMQSWMFLSSYQQLRLALQHKSSIDTMVHMGNMVMGIAFGTSATVWKSRGASARSGAFCFIDYRDIDATGCPSAFPPQNERNAGALVTGGFYRRSAHDFQSIAGSPITYWLGQGTFSFLKKAHRLDEIGDARMGLATGNNDRYVRLWHEVSIRTTGFGMSSREQAKESRNRWFPYSKGGPFRKWYGNNDHIVDWMNDGAELQKHTPS